jgi:hypothetical protein
MASSGRTGEGGCVVGVCAGSVGVSEAPLDGSGSGLEGSADGDADSLAEGLADVLLVGSGEADEGAVPTAAMTSGVTSAAAVTQVAAGSIEFRLTRAGYGCAPTAEIAPRR